MIHQYRMNGYNIVIDVNSASVHSVDPVAYDAIEMFETHTRDEIVDRLTKKYVDDGLTSADVDDVLSDIEELKTSGKLFTSDTNELISIDFKKRHTVLKALCLHVSHTCNLNCEYCFAAQGKYCGQRGLMSIDVAKRSIDYLIEQSGTRKNLEVDFFGGEPLMNWEVVKETVAYARSIEKEKNKNFRFTLTTNGMLLDDEVTDFCNKEMHNVVLSLDGRRKVHDNLRKTPDGHGSYDTIVPKFQRFVKLRGDKEYYMRGTFTHANTDFTEDIFNMAELGFTKLSMEPVVCKPDDKYALTDDDLPVLYDQYEKLAIDMLRREKEGKPITFYHYMIDLTGGPCIYKRLSGCGSGTEYVAVTPWGELYPCHQFVGDKKYSLGNIWDGITNIDVQEKFKCCNVYAKPECNKCWAKLYCSGGCAANAYHATGSVLGTYDYGCKLFCHRMECAIMMKVAEQFPAQ